MSKRTPRSIKKSCDKVFSILIRSRGRCERCGSRDNLQTAHIYSRKFGSVRFDEDNAVCLCARCHRWGHDNPVDFTRWLDEYLPTGHMIKLLAKKNQIVKRKLADWLELEEELKQKLNEKTK